jgi:hypothetical protein
MSEPTYLDFYLSLGRSVGRLSYLSSCGNTQNLPPVNDGAGCRRRAGPRLCRASARAAAARSRSAQPGHAAAGCIATGRGRWGNQPGSTRSARPRNWRSELIPIAAWQTASATSSASLVSAGRPCLIREHIRCNDRHLEHKGQRVWKPFFVKQRVPAKPAPTFTSSL